MVRRTPEPAAAGAGGDEQVPQGRRISRPERTDRSRQRAAPACPRTGTGCNGKQTARQENKKHGEEFMRHVSLVGPPRLLPDRCRWRRKRPTRRPTSTRARPSPSWSGTRVGGSIGNTSLLVSRHLGRFIPGNPTVILRQMPGGAHLNATNHVYNVADADGLTILGAQSRDRDGAARQGAAGALRRAASSSGSARPAPTARCSRSARACPTRASRISRTPRRRSWSAPPVPARTRTTFRCC